MEGYYCDFNQNHVLIHPKLLPCGATACSKCIEEAKKDQLNTKITCLYCKREHSVKNLPKNLKIEDLIKRNSGFIVGNLVEKFECLLVECQETFSYRGLSTEEYFDKIRKNITDRVFALKAYIDELSEQLFSSIDQLEADTLIGLDKLNDQFAQNIDGYQDLSKTLLRETTKDEFDYEALFNAYELNGKNKQELIHFKEEFYKIQEKYQFQPNDWMPSINIFGKLVDKDFEFFHKETHKLEVKEAVKIFSMCTLDGQIYTVEDKKTRRLKVYDGNFEFLRDSDVLEDSMYRLSANLALTTDSVDSLFVCDRGDSTVYVLDKSLKGIFKCIGRVGSTGGNFHGPVDIDEQMSMLFVLDAGNSRVQVLDIDGSYIDQFQLFQKGSNELLDDAANISVCETMIAVNSPKFGIFIFNANMQLKLIIEQKDVKTILFVGNHLFAHTQQGLLFCYQIYASHSKKFYHQTVFSFKNEEIKHSSASMLWLSNEKKLCISFAKQKKLAFLGFN